MTVEQKQRLGIGKPVRLSLASQPGLLRFVSESVPPSLAAPLGCLRATALLPSRLPWLTVRFLCSRTNAARVSVPSGTARAWSPSEAAVGCGAVAVDCRRAGLDSCGKPQPMRMPMCTFLQSTPWRHPLTACQLRTPPQPLMPTDRGFVTTACTARTHTAQARTHGMPTPAFNSVRIP